MREIKFKAWDAKRKKMWSAEEMGKDQLTLMPDGRGFVNVSGTSTKLSRFLPHLIPLQFTGLKDKSGVEIYEGNILKDDNGEIGVVKFGKLPLDKSGDCVCTYQSFYVKCFGKLGQAPMYECVDIGDWMEVVGSIHQNPELLGAK